MPSPASKPFQWSGTLLREAFLHALQVPKDLAILTPTRGPVQTFVQPVRISTNSAPPKLEGTFPATPLDLRTFAVTVEKSAELGTPGFASSTLAEMGIHASPLGPKETVSVEQLLADIPDLSFMLYSDLQVSNTAQKGKA